MGIRQFLFLLSLFLLAWPVSLLSNTDSLRIEFHLATDDTTRIQLLTQIGDHYERSMPDSALFYYKQGLKIGEASQMDNIRIAEQQGLLLRYIGIIYRNKGEYATALEYYQKALDLFRQHDLKKGISAVYNNFGVVYRNLGNYPRAIDYYFRALAIFEETGDRRGAAFCNNNIGIIYDVQKEYGLALDYYRKAAQVFEQDQDLARLGSTQMNIGIVYMAIGNLDHALSYYRQALDNLLPHQRKAEASRTYMNMGLAFAQLEQYQEALEHLEQAQQLALEIDDRKGMASIFRHQAEIQMKQGMLANSHQSALWALEVAETIDALDDKTMAYHTLLRVAEASENLPLAYEYARKYIALNDSLHNLEKARVIFELEATYQNDKKQQEIELLSQRQEVQRLQLKESRSQLRLQRVITLLVVVLMVAGSVSLWLKIRQNRKIRSINQQLASQNHEIQKKNTEISLQRNEINNQRNVVLAQKNQILEQHEALREANRKILAGIRYAEHIQSSLFPDEAYLNQHLGDSFILFKPRHMVSGDFYWMAPKHDKILLAVADCTGHGVAGGLISMLGIAFLNDALNQEVLQTAADYLEYITRRFDESLLVSEEGRQASEGMEVSFCIYDPLNGTLEFSGANASMVMVRNNQLTSIRGDRRPIGQHNGSGKAFTSRTLDLNPGDMVYIFSDGYINQFGGSRGQRFTSSAFFKLLENISPHNLSYQKSLLENELERWKAGLHEQVDDILVLGFRALPKGSLQMSRQTTGYNSSDPQES